MRRKNIYVKDSSEDIARQEEIIKRADYSLAILGLGAVYRASGRFLNISNELSDRLVS